MMLVDQVAQSIRLCNNRVGAAEMAEMILQAVSDHLMLNAVEWQEAGRVLWREDVEPRGKETMWAEMPNHQVKRLAEALKG